MKKAIAGFVIVLVGCNTVPPPLSTPEGMNVVVGGIGNTQPFFGAFKSSGLRLLEPEGGGAFLLASCGCGDWRALFKADDGSPARQFAVRFYTPDEYTPTASVTVFGSDDEEDWAVRGTVDQVAGEFCGVSRDGANSWDITAQRGDAHNLTVVACGMCHIGEDSVYPLPPTHPDRYKSDPLVCLECHSVNGQ